MHSPHPLLADATTIVRAAGPIVAIALVLGLSKMNVNRARVHRLAVGTVAYLAFVILFGAVVRITGSGAGCGQHWPTCHGEVLHLPQSIETTIELTHRVTSGFSMLVCLALLVLGIRQFPRRHPARIGAIATFVFICVEALIGARLVLLGLVGLNDSWPRATWMAIHLTSTCALTGAAILTVWASRPAMLPTPPAMRSDRAVRLLVAGLFAVFLVSATGAVTALGDTLYPVEASSTLEGLAADAGEASHFLRRLRFVHPLMAVVAGVYVVWLGLTVGKGDARIERVGTIAAVLVFAQVTAGVANIMLSAPGWMQVVHLGLAVSVWLSLVWMTLNAAVRAGAST